MKLASPCLCLALFCSAPVMLAAAPVDVAPFGLPLPESHGIFWEDPREIHEVVVEFAGAAPPPQAVKLEYWGSHWPEEHLPKDKDIGSGGSGWMELGNWYRYGWRTADTEATAEGNAVHFSFHPVNASEFPKLKNYPATFRYTLKIRVSAAKSSDSVSDRLPEIKSIRAYTDSVWEERAVRVVWDKPAPAKTSFEAFNGSVKQVEKTSSRSRRLLLAVTANPDPNTFDRTLVTVRDGRKPFTFAIDDLAEGPLFLPEFGAAVLKGDDARDYTAIAAAQKANGAKTLYERVSALPEQTWRAAWDGMPPKNPSSICLWAWTAGASVSA